MNIISLSDLLGFFSFVRRRVGISLVDPMPEAEVNSGIVTKLAIRITNGGHMGLKRFTVSACPSLRFGYTTSEHFSHTVRRLLPGDSIDINVFDPYADILHVSYTITLHRRFLFKERIIASSAVRYIPR